ncbi:MAG: hypothetical protein HY816_17850 [Candidatus Wallbacteria bacterium]|nr:hypothetical protein [Candidatus Wallbacteria bacterium]
MKSSIGRLGFLLLLGTVHLVCTVTNAQAAAPTVRLEAPEIVDRQSGFGGVGAPFELKSVLTNPGPGTIDVLSAGVGFATTAGSVDAQYIVTRPAFPAVVSAGQSRTLTFAVRTWATAVRYQTISATVKLNALDHATGSSVSTQATTSWKVLEGADRVLGQPTADFDSGLQRGLQDPWGVHSDGARLFVSDTVNHRVLIYTPVPTSTDFPAPNLVIGQADLSSNIPNLGGTSSRSLAAPTGVHSDGRRLFIADTDNNRVLIFDPIPAVSGAAASVVLGQADFTSRTANAGGVSATSLNQPRGVYSDGTKLLVADFGNNRVLVWNQIPTRNGQPADFVLGQGLMSSNTINFGGVNGRSMNGPSHAWIDGNRLYVADTNNWRVLVWNSVPTSSFTSATFGLGTPNLGMGMTGQPDRSLFFPTWVSSDGLKLYVTDAQNNRVVIHDPVPTQPNAAASRVVGQSSFFDVQPQTGAAGLGQPRAAFSDGQRLFVTDQNSDRVAIYDSIPAASGASMNHVIGKPDAQGAKPENSPGTPTASALFSPSGVAVSGGRLIVSFNSLPAADGADADLLLGQSVFTAISLRTPATFACRSTFFPADVAVAGSRLFVVARDSHRVLAWNTVPVSSDISADYVLGQQNLTSDSANAGNGTQSSGRNLFNPQAVATDGTNFAIADTSHGRVLIYTSIPTTTFQSATICLGNGDLSTYPTFSTTTAKTLRQPTNVALASGKVLVTDSDSNRVLIWNSIPAQSATDADLVIGQTSFTVGTASSIMQPGPAKLRMPQDVASDGVRMAVADTGNHRVLLWNAIPAVNGQPADSLIGHADFDTSIVNDGRRLSAFSLNLPADVKFEGDSLWVTDDNRRLLRFDLPPATRVSVNAGLDREANLGAPVSLSGAASSPAGGPFAYQWTVEDSPAPVTLTTPLQAATSFVPTTGGRYALKLTATDSGAVSGIGRVHVLVNSAPVAVTAGARTINPTATVVLDARRSFDPDGDPLTYLWSVPLVEAAGTSLPNANTAVTSFKPTPNTTYAVSLTVSDGRGGQASQQFDIRVRRDPIARVLANTTAGASQAVELDGTLSSNPDGGAITYLWSQRSGTTVALTPSATAPIVTFMTPEFDSTLQFALTVSNASGGVATATASIAVDGTPPVATLAYPQGTVASTKGPFSFQVNFSEPINSSAATPAVTFVRTAGTGTLPGGVLRRRASDVDAKLFEYSFEAGFLANGTYDISLSAADAERNPLAAQPANRTLVVNVPNNPPVALAVGPFTATTGSTVALDGTGSSDPDADSITYLWSGTDPQSISLTFSNPTSARTSFVPVLTGSHTVQLVVTDINGRASLVSGLSINVSPGAVPNAAPVVSAGADRLVPVGRVVTLSGSASDPDNDALTYRWTLSSVPAGSGVTTGPLPDAQGGRTLAAFFTPSVPGTYFLVLRALDGRGLDSSSTITVLADDHANTAAEVDPAQAFPSAGATKTATLEAAGDLDFFSFDATPGDVYRASLVSQTVPNPELALVDRDGATVLSAAAGSPSTTARLAEFRPPRSDRYYLRVRVPAGTQSGTYRVTLDVVHEGFARPPRTRLVTRKVSGQFEATVSTDGTSSPLSFFQFLTEYDSADLSLVSRTAESGASGFTIDAAQFSLPFVDTLLTASNGARPLPPASLVSLGFKPIGAKTLSDVQIDLLAVTATPPPPLARVSVFRPTADAGLDLTLALRTPQAGPAQLPDFVLPGAPLGPYLRLDGRDSHDANTPPLPLAYSWRLLEAPGGGVTLVEPSAPTPTATLAGAGRYRFALTVSNGVLSSPTSVVTLLVTGNQHSPHAEVRVASSAAPDQPVPATAGAFVTPSGATVTLDASGSTDLEASDRAALSYLWEMVEGPLPVQLASRAVVSFSAVLTGVYRFRLTVRDPGGLLSRPAEVFVVVADPSDSPATLSLQALSPSTTSAGLDLGADPELSDAPSLELSTGEEVIVQAQAGDAELDRGSQKGLFFWKQLEGPAVQLAQQDTPPIRSRVTFTPVEPGVIELECRLLIANSDGTPLGPEVRRRIRVIAEDAKRPLPEAQAAVGPAQGVPKAKRAPAGAQDSTVELTPGTVARLDAGGSTSDGATIAYQWVQVRGPTVELSNPFASVTTFVVPVLGDSASRDYAFQLYVDDADTGDLRSAPAAVEFSAVSNRAPIADAGADRSVAAGALVPLAGSGTDPENAALAYSWRQVSGPSVALSDATTRSPTFRPLDSGVYVFGLRVNDGQVLSAEDRVTITATAGSNRPPSAGAGMDRTVLAGTLVTLSSSSSDPETTALTYRWRQVSGPAAALSDAAAASPTFTPSQAGSYVFGLTVSDGALDSPEDFVTITAVPGTNLPPIAGAGPDRAVLLGVVVTLAGTATDPEARPLTYRWRQLSGPPVTLTSTTDLSPTFTANVAGSLVFGLVARDGELDSAEDFVTIAAVAGTNLPPAADAGTDRSALLGTVVSLAGAGLDPEGRPVTYRWRQVAGPGVTLSDPASASPTFTSTAAGAHVFGLTVRDGALDSSEDFVTIAIVSAANLPPAADAGADFGAFTGASVGLSGTGTDPEGRLLTYRWRQISGPSAALSSATTASPEFTPASIGSYVFGLKTHDGAFVSEEDFVTVTVTRAPVLEDPSVLTLTAGLNLIGVPFDPSTTGTPFDLAALAARTGSSYVGYDFGRAPGSRWRIFVPGLGLPSPEVRGDRAYLVNVAGTQPVVVTFAGRPWPSAQSTGLAVEKGFGNMAIPGRPGLGWSVAELIQVLGARLAVVSVPLSGGRNQFRTLVGASEAALAARLRSGTGYLYFTDQSGEASLAPLQTDRPQTGP